MYHLLTGSFKSQEQKLVAHITKAVSSQRIYMLESNVQKRRTESVFMPEAPSYESPGCYYFLILTTCDEDVKVVQGKIENKAPEIIPVIAIVLPAPTFITWMMEGHPFADIVSRRAVLLYQSDEEEPDTPEVVQAMKVEKKNILYDEANNKVTEFIASAVLYMIGSESN